MNRFVITITPDTDGEPGGVAQTTVRVDTSTGQTRITELTVRAADNTGLAQSDLPEINLDLLVRALAPQATEPAMLTTAPSTAPATTPATAPSTTPATAPAPATSSVDSAYPDVADDITGAGAPTEHGRPFAMPAEATVFSEPVPPIAEARPVRTAPPVAAGSQRTTARKTPQKATRKATRKATTRTAAGRKATPAKTTPAKTTTRATVKTAKTSTKAATKATTKATTKSATKATKAAAKATGGAAARKATGTGPAGAKNATAAKNATVAKTPGKKTTSESGRPYRRMPEPSEVLAAYGQIGTITGVADAFGVPRHTAASWARRLRQQGHSIGRN